MGKRDKATAVCAREILVDAISGAIASHKGDWLSVAEDLAAKLAVQYLRNQDDVDGMLDQIVALARRAERTERRLEHYRRKTAARAEQALREDPEESAIGDNLDLANMVAFRRNHYELAKSYIRSEARARMALHAQGKGVP